MVNRLTSSVPMVTINTSGITSELEADKIQEPQSSSQLTINNDGIDDLQLPLEKAKKMTDSMNKFLEITNTELRFKYHEKLDQYYVTLVDSKTEEVVREIPSKKLMDMYAAMCEFVGFFVDEKI